MTSAIEKAELCLSNNDPLSALTELELYAQQESCQSQYAYVEFLKGVAYSLLLDHARAIVCYKNALQAGQLPKDSKLNALNNMGASLEAQELYEEALSAYEKALQEHAGFSRAKFNRANILFKLDRFEEARSSYENLLTQFPDEPLLLTNYANTLFYTGKYQEALKQYLHCGYFKKNSVENLNHIGSALVKLKRADESIFYYEQALRLRPNCHETHNNIGLAYLALQQLDNAINAFNNALSTNPKASFVYQNFGRLYSESGHFELAVSNYRKAIDLNATDSAYNGLGLAYGRVHRMDEALACFQESLKLNPKNPNTYNDLGVAYQHSNFYEAARAAFATSLELEPKNPDATWNIALLDLLHGDYEMGWRRYEARREANVNFKVQEFQKPFWDGHFDLTGKSILIHHEQGLGDTLQMLRFVPGLVNKARKVYLLVPTPLVTISKSVSPEVSVVQIGESLPFFDYHCPFMSLPLALGVSMHNVPNGPYLRPAKVSSEHWQESVGGREVFKVGFVWSGSQGHKNDANRSIPLHVIQPLFNLDIESHSLQCEYRKVDTPIGKVAPELIDHSVLLGDLNETAALVDVMDLIITVDTSIAHLAGAMGKRVWILLPYQPDFRWLLDREDSPWYRTARLFRQKKVGQWDDVIQEVATCLGEIVELYVANQGYKIQQTRSPVER